MKKDFKLYIAACIKCSKFKQPRAYLKAPLSPIIYSTFNQAVAIDHIVPSQQGRTAQGNRNILTITDMWSNYLVAVPTKTQTTEETIKHILKQWILKFGVMTEVISDNGPAFTAKLYAAVCKAFGIHHITGTPYKSSSSAKAEMSNKKVNNALRAALPSDQLNKWDIYLPYVTFALNSIQNRNTGYSPNFLVFARELNLPHNLLVQQNDNDQISENTKHGKQAYRLHRDIKTVLHKVRSNVQQSLKYTTKAYNKNIHGPYFKEGEYCMVLINCPKHKFGPKWVGPKLVLRRISDHLYVLRWKEGQEKVTNITKLKHYTPNRFSKTTSTSPVIKQGSTLDTSNTIVTNSAPVVPEVTDYPYILINPQMPEITMTNPPPGEMAINPTAGEGQHITPQGMRVVPSKIKIKNSWKNPYHPELVSAEASKNVLHPPITLDRTAKGQTSNNAGNICTGNKRDRPFRNTGYRTDDMPSIVSGSNTRDPPSKHASKGAMGTSSDKGDDKPEGHSSRLPENRAGSRPQKAKTDKPRNVECTPASKSHSHRTSSTAVYPPINMTNDTARDSTGNKNSNITTNLTGITNSSSTTNTTKMQTAEAVENGGKTIARTPNISPAHDMQQSSQAITPQEQNNTRGNGRGLETQTRKSSRRRRLPAKFKDFIMGMIRAK